MAPATLEALLEHPALWRGEMLARTAQPGLSTGFVSLDAELPGGGWPVGALTELLTEREAVGEFSLLLPALARLTQSGRGVALIAPPYPPYAPALAGQGVVLSRLLVVDPGTPRDALWAAEQALRGGSMGAVVYWPGEIAPRALARLQLAAEAGGSAGFLYRPATVADEPSPAALRIVLGGGPEGLRLHVRKRRGAPQLRPLLLPRVA